MVVDVVMAFALPKSEALILRSREAASRRMLLKALEPSFETQPKAAPQDEG